jgi:hypothetical protein
MNNSQVAHLWAAQNPNKTQARGSHFYFEGATIYSYGPHFPIARFTADKDGVPVVIITRKGYSNSTAKHIGLVHRAIPGHVARSYADNVQDDPATLLPAEHARAQGLLRAVLGGRQTKSFAASRRYVEAIVAFDNVVAIAEDFGLTNPTTAEDRAQIETCKSRLQEIGRALEEREARREEREKAQFAEALPKWLSGERQSPPPSAYSHPPRLRVIQRERDSDPVVQTSHGAEVDLSKARRSFDFIAKVWQGPGHWEKNGATHQVGPFELLHITPQQVRVGCHTFEREHVEQFAAAQGWG